MLTSKRHGEMETAERDEFLSFTYERARREKLLTIRLYFAAAVRELRPRATPAPRYDTMRLGRQWAPINPKESRMLFEFIVTCFFFFLLNNSLAFYQWNVPKIVN